MPHTALNQADSLENYPPQGRSRVFEPWSQLLFLLSLEYDLMRDFFRLRTFFRGALTVLIAIATNAFAAPIVWTVPSTTLTGGSSISGTFTYDTVTSTLSAINIVQTGGLGSTFNTVAITSGGFIRGQTGAFVGADLPGIYINVSALPAGGGAYTATVGVGTCYAAINFVGGLCGNVGAPFFTGTITSAVTPAAAVVPPIPNLLALPSMPSVGSQLRVLDLASGSGPAMTTCLLNAVKQVFGSEATYLGQSKNVAALISVGGQTISFYPLFASTSTALGIGVFPTSDNALNVGTSCGTFSVSPAVANVLELGTALTAMGLQVQVDNVGVITATVNGNLYALRPDYFVTRGTATGIPSLKFGSDGVLRFTDSAGNIQILRAAFLYPIGLQAHLGTALGGLLSIQVDGSGVFTRFNGSQLLLTPEMVLTPATSINDWINDKGNHYLYRIAAYFQGLAAVAR